VVQCFTLRRLLDFLIIANLKGDRYSNVGFVPAFRKQRGDSGKPGTCPFASIESWLGRVRAILRFRTWPAAPTNLTENEDQSAWLQIAW
jgi:hypothetical protein